MTVPSGTQPTSSGGRRPARRWSSGVRILLVGVAVGLGVAAIARDSQGFVDALRTIGVGRTSLAVLLVTVGLYTSAIAWRCCVAALAGQLQRNVAYRVFFISQLGKYLPGALWPVVAQLDAARRNRLTVAGMGAASLLFLGLHFLTGLLVVAALLPWATPVLLGQHPWIWLLLPPAAISLTPPVLARLLRVAGRLLHREILAERQLRWSTVARPTSWLALTWFMYGAAATVITSPLTPSEGVWLIASVATGGFALSWVVGVLVLPAPAGVGPREAVLVLALTPLVGVASATSVAIVLRVVHTFGDLALAGLARVSERRNRPRQQAMGSPGRAGRSSGRWR